VEQGAAQLKYGVAEVAAAFEMRAGGVRAR
jgi:hypothetical protein